MFVVYAMLAYLVAAMVIAWVILRGVRKRDRHNVGGDLHAASGRSVADARLLHRVTLRGRTLRFYRSPLVGPDFPWTVLRDLFEIATDGATYTVSAEWIYAGNPGLAQAILTDAGVELLLSHHASLELLATLTADIDERTSLIAEFRELMAEAYVLQWAGLSREEFLALCAAASGRQHHRTA
jgi:hypothetical protein